MSIYQVAIIVPKGSALHECEMPHRLFKVSFLWLLPFRSPKPSYTGTLEFLLPLGCGHSRWFTLDHQALINFSLLTFLAFSFALRFVFICFLRFSIQSIYSSANKDSFYFFLCNLCVCKSLVLSTPLTVGSLYITCSQLTVFSLLLICGGFLYHEWELNFIKKPFITSW